MNRYYLMACKYRVGHKILWSSRKLSKSQNFSTLAADFDRAVQWFSDLGLNFPPTRIGFYRKDIIALAKAFEEGSLEDFLQKRPVEELRNSLNESSEMILIYRGLGGLTDHDLVRSIKKLIKGPINPKDEQPNHQNRQARDIGFELCMAAHFAAAGFTIDFGSEADLSSFDGSTQLFVECKRPTATDNIEDNVHKALKQLTSRYNNFGYNGNSRGIVALSIGKILNPEHKVLKAKNRDDLKQQLNTIVEIFIRDYEHHWQQNLDIRTLGVIVHIQTLAEIESEVIYTTCQQIGINNITLPNHIQQAADHSYLLSIARRLNEAVAVLHSMGST